MAKRKFHHIGVPTSEKREDSSYVKDGKVYVTDAQSHPYNIEFLYFEQDSPMPEIVKTTAHIAFMVDSVDEELKGKAVVCEPFDANESLRVAFFRDGDALIEVMEQKQ